MNFLRSTRWVLFSVGTVGFILSQTGARAQQVRENRRSMNFSSNIEPSRSYKKYSLHSNSLSI